MSLCYYEGCGQRADHVCMCLTPEQTYVCAGHLKEHISVPGPRPHYNRPLYLTPPEDVKAYLLSYFKNKIRSLNSLRKQVEEELLELPNEQEAAHKIFAMIEEDLERFKYFLGEVQNRIDVPKDNPNEIEKLLSTSTVEGLSSELKNFVPKSQELLDRDEQFHTPETPKCVGFDICLFQHNTKNLRSISFRDWEIEDNELSLPFNVDFRTCMCLIPDGKIFCFGSMIDAKVTGVTFTMAFDNKVQVLAVGTPCRSSSAAFFEGCVYCFGGNDGNQPMTLAERYSLERNVWTKLPVLPNSTYYASTCVFANKMLISGLGLTFMFIYDPLAMSYDKTLTFADEGSTKIICEGLGRAFVIETKGKIYESGIGNPYDWQPVENSDIPNWHLVSHRASFMNYVYFIIDEYPCPGLYYFSLDGKFCKRIKKILDKEQEISYTPQEQAPQPEIQSTA
ncbi:unnamed protein product [Blepharisma stoltei]|uniref:Uncharacterized protein n=1 Tax=Blepharisma stoltei TaxID=1481888 RepID=A0AAU9K9N0_9CILI|nr:unnamed protein product [Blepharisma stoltei]